MLPFDQLNCPDRVPQGHWWVFKSTWEYAYLVFCFPDSIDDFGLPSIDQPIMKIYMSEVVPLYCSGSVSTSKDMIPNLSMRILSFGKGESINDICELSYYKVLLIVYCVYCIIVLPVVTKG